MCMGGGSNRAQQQAEQNERERQEAIRRGTAAVNQAFDDPSRRGYIEGDFLDATRAYLGEDLDRQKSDNDRQLKFAMARSGLAGGSAQVDAAREAGEVYNRGKLEVERRSQGAVADLLGADEQARLNLLAMVQSGLDATTASQRASSAMRNNLLSGKSSSVADGLGDVFGQFADVYRRSQQAKAERDAQKYQFNTVYQPGYFTGAGFGGG